MTVAAGQRAELQCELPWFVRRRLGLRSHRRFAFDSLVRVRLFARIPLHDDVLPAGGAVREGATLYVCQYLLHRHPCYFPQPERFDPARFAPERRPPRYVYLPFGDGLHRCLGEQLAHLEAVLVVAHVAQRVRLELVDGGPARPYAGVTLRPRAAVWATPQRRRRL